MKISNKEYPFHILMTNEDKYFLSFIHYEMMKVFFHNLIMNLIYLIINFEFKFNSVSVALNYYLFRNLY